MTPHPPSNHWCKRPPPCISPSHSSPFQRPPGLLWSPTNGAISKDGASLPLSALISSAYPQTQDRKKKTKPTQQQPQTHSPKSTSTPPYYSPPPQTPAASPPTLPSPPSPTYHTAP